MKRKLTIFAGLLTLLLGVYSGVAWSLLRGAGAYRMGTTMGKVLSASWQYTTLAAVVLLAILILRLAWYIRRKKVGDPVKPAEASGKTGDGEKKKEKDSKAEKTAAAEKVAPTGAAAPMESGEKVPPAGMIQEEEKIAPTDAAAPMESEEKAEADAPRCAVCGSVLKPGYRFCGECGAKVIGGGV